MADRYSELIGSDHNMLIRSQWPHQRNEFANYLTHESSTIEQLVAHHLSLRPHQACKVALRRDWLCGSFNVCVPVTIDDDYQVLVRCPLPYRFTSPHSTAGDKIRGEAATFAWLSSHCATVPIPRLLGFGLPDGRSFTPLVHASWVRQAFEWLRRQAHRVFGDIDYWRPFVPSSSPARLETGYLITEFINQGRMLSMDWPSHNPAYRQTLFRSLANILLDLTRVPLPRIGSFTVCDTGEVTLSRRPTTVALASLEAEGISSDIFPNTTYTSVDTYVEDLLYCHDTRLREQPNAVDGDDDAEAQMATVVVLRAIRSQFINRRLRKGPFVLQLTDLHEQNIFVDDQYNITAIVDLEWCCSLPLEMQQLPFWLSGHNGDDFLGDEATKNEEAYVTACEQFLEIFSQEQSRRSAPQLPVDVGSVIKAGLKKKSHWYFAAISHPRNAYSFLLHHLQPIFAPSHSNFEEALTFQSMFAPYYTPDASNFARQKINEKAEYDQALRALVKE